MHATAILVLALLARHAPAVESRATAGEEDFLQAWAVAAELAGIQRWSGAARQLDELLDRHERAPYVVPHLAAIVELYERCAFFAAHPEPDPKSLVAGDLQLWDVDSGRLILRYDELPGDFERDADVLVHPLELAGPYRVTLRGTMPLGVTSAQRAEPIQVLVCVEGSRSHQVVFGFPRFEDGGRVRWVPPKLIENVAGATKVLHELAATPLEPGRPFELQVEVSDTAITAVANGKSLFSAPKPRELFGRVALIGTTGVEEVTLAGRGNPGWLRGKADAAMAREREAFRRTWDPAARVPAWVLEALPRRAVAKTSPMLSFALRVATSQVPVLERLSDLYASGETAAGLAAVAALDDGDLAPELRLLFRTLFLLEEEALEPALVSIDAAIAAAPDFVEARVIRGRVLGRLGRVDEALDVLRGIVASGPESSLAWSECARWCLSAGRPGEAKTVVDRALMAGVDPAALADVQSLLVRALSGPIWERSHEYSSAHFRVRSDLNRQVCFDAAQVLEESLRLYERRLGRLSSARRAADERSPVYVFAGRAGYDAYGADVFGLAPETTAGAFSPVLGQLLVWSPANRADMLETLRHEGLHQFLDGLIGPVPVWLNEGLAEYFENAKSVRGTLVDGVPQERHLTTLLDPRTTWIPFDELFTLGPQAFYADATLHYAESWALVHWLQTSGLAAGRVFQSMVDDLAQGAPPHEVHARLLAVGELTRKVREHLETLERGSSPH